MLHKTFILKKVILNMDTQTEYNEELIPSRERYILYEGEVAEYVVEYGSYPDRDKEYEEVEREHVERSERYFTLDEVTSDETGQTVDEDNATRRQQLLRTLKGRVAESNRELWKEFDTEYEDFSVFVDSKGKQYKLSFKEQT